MSSKISPTHVNKPSYTDRMVEYIKSKSNPKTDVSGVIALIKDFSEQEYQKKKDMTNQMPFGKYKFRAVKDIAVFDPQYLKWLVKRDMMDNYDDLRTEILKHL